MTLFPYDINVNPFDSLICLTPDSRNTPNQYMLPLKINEKAIFSG